MAKLKRATEQTNKIIALLAKHYPDPKSELSFANTYQLVVSVLLSAQCTDKKVNQVTPLLFEAFPSFQDLACAKVTRLEEIIRPINYYKTKAKHLIKLGQIVSKDLGGVFPLNRSQTLSLPGIGTKTANVVLGELGVEHTLPVDTHVFRVSQRLGWAKGKTPQQIEDQLKSRFPSSLWRNLHHWLILHGRKICKAKNPGCAVCPLKKICPQLLA